MSEKPAEEVIHEELEARIAADPDNLENYSVYADWLQKNGNRRGELMAIECELERLYRARKAFMDAHGAEFYLDLTDHTGDLVEPYMYGDFDPEVNLTWGCGFVNTVYISTDTPWQEPEERLAEFVRRALDLPSCRMVREVHFSTSGNVSREDQADIGARVRRLRDTLERVHFSPHSTSAAFTAALFGDGQPWPRLKNLDLYRLVDDNGELVVRKYYAQLPALTQLSFSSQEGDSPVLEWLLESPLLQQLEILDLSYGSLQDEAVELLRERPERFEHLQRILLRSNNLTNTEFPGLDNVTVGNQH